MDFLNLLAEARTPLITTLASGVTALGEETVLLLIGMLLLWCSDKRRGFHFLFIAMMANNLCGLLKLICRVPRPWMRQPGIAVESAKGNAMDYSFPSGHSLNAGCGAAVLADWKHTSWSWCLAAAVTALVALSRMVLGVHTPQDVLVGGLLGLLLSAVLLKVMDKAESSGHPWVVPLAGLGFSVIALLYAALAPKGAANVESCDLNGLENLWTATGVLAGAVIGFVLDEKKLHFDTRAIWWAQLLKIVLGGGILMGLRVGLKAVLPAVPFLRSGLRYFVIAIFATAIWPMTFPFFAKLGQPRS